VAELLTLPEKLAAGTSSRLRLMNLPEANTSAKGFGAHGNDAPVVRAGPTGWMAGVGGGGERERRFRKTTSTINTIHNAHSAHSAAHGALDSRPRPHKQPHTWTPPERSFALPTPGVCGHLLTALGSDQAARAGEDEDSGGGDNGGGEDGAATTQALGRVQQSVGPAKHRAARGNKTWQDTGFILPHKLTCRQGSATPGWGCPAP
jgi:hypothetical protein